MKTVVIGGSGLIGAKLLERLEHLGCEAMVASRSSGVDIITGKGLKEVLRGAGVVVDVTNSPSFEDKAVLDFFETASRNILTIAESEKVGHHIALSIVGVDRLEDSGYMRAKVAQEKIIQKFNIPFTIVRATQFFEFLGAIADSCMHNGIARIPDASMQPIAANDVAFKLAEIAMEEPRNKIIELSGPQRFKMDEAIRYYLTARGDDRTITTDRQAKYFGAQLDDSSLTPTDNPILGTTTLEKWLEDLNKEA